MYRDILSLPEATQQSKRSDSSWLLSADGRIGILGTGMILKVGGERGHLFFRLTFCFLPRERGQRGEGMCPGSQHNQKPHIPDSSVADHIYRASVD